MQKKKNISTYLSVANYVADKIAIEIKKNYKQLNITLSKKSSPYQVVTDLDLKVEKIARKLISSKFPDHNIIGEEFENIDKNSDFTWIIDPIAGSYKANFFPFLSTPFSPVIIPFTLLFSNRISLAVNPGKISTPRVSAYFPSHLHKLPKLII